MAAAAGWGYIDAAIKSVDDPTPSTVVINLKYPWAPLLADLSLFANGIVPEQLRRQDRGPVLPGPDRHRPVQVGLLAQGLGAQAGQEHLLLAEGPALPEQRDLDRRAQRQHQAAAGQGRPGADRPVPVLVHGVHAEGHARREHGPVQLDARPTTWPSTRTSSRSRTCTCAGRSRWPSTATRWSRRCCSATASPPTRCSRRRCRTTTRTRRATSTTWPQAKAADGPVQRAARVHHDDAAPVRQLRLRHDRHDRAGRAQAARHHGQDPDARPEHGQRRTSRARSTT